MYPLKANPDDDVLRTRLLKVYLGLHQVDVAISTASTYLLHEGGDKTETNNHLGNAYAMKGDMTQAALNYKQAAALLPEDMGIRRNLAQALQALQALGRAQSAEPNSVEIAATGGEAPRGAAEIGVESFYWME